ncbi:MAG: hypothetical protein HYT42_00435 [Candidatus Sungbacteria bacterium]|nr:hypothetical protein [Candidatus Sungbacteria bacterium]
MTEINVGQEQTPHQEIAELERLLAEKRKTLELEGQSAEEKEVFKEAFRETYGEVLAPKTPVVNQPQPVLPAEELDKRAEELKTKEREEQLESLIALAVTKGVTAAAEVARQATPWLMDELHDRLRDKYYEHLIAARKLKAL